MRITRPVAVMLCGLVTFTLSPTVGAVDAEAQGRRAVRRPAASRSPARRAVRPSGRIVYSGGFGYRPYAYGFYSPFFYGPYSYPYYGLRYDDRGAVRLQAKPEETEVYVDGYYVGVVDSYDGVFQRLRLPPGEHEIELYLEGYESIREMLYLVPGETYKIHHEMQPLSEGVPQPPRPEPLETPVPPPFPERSGRGAFPPGAVAEHFGTLAVRIQPADAEVLIDGERWRGFEGVDRLVVELGAGLHVVEVRRDGYRPYRTDIDVRDGDTTLLNVSLPRADGDIR